jgi:MFS transporter, PPP family, 3-phenylpropionic acid transporter
MDPTDLGGSERKTPMLKAKLFYFLYFWGLSALFPYFALYYESLGLTGPQVGTLMALMPLVTLVSAPLWSGLADATRRHKTILLITTVGAIAGAWGLLQADAFLALLPLVATYALFLSPILPMVDSAVLAMLGDRREAFGRQRALGALGPALAGPLISILTGRFGLAVPFYGFIAAYGGIAILVTQMPIRSGETQTAFGPGLRRLVRNPQLARFLFIVFLGMMGYATKLSFLYARLDELGAPESLMGFALMMGTVGELPLLLASGRLMRKWGANGMLTASLAAMTTMLLAYSWVRVPGWMLAGELLHGLAYSGMCVAGVAYADAMAPPGMAATTQGLFNAVFGGIAIAAGTFLGSLIRDRWGSPAMFRTAGLVALTALVLFVLTSEGKRKEN